MGNKKRTKGARAGKNKKQRRHHAVQSNQSNIPDQEQAQPSEGKQREEKVMGPDDPGFHDMQDNDENAAGAGQDDNQGGEPSSLSLEDKKKAKVAAERAFEEIATAMSIPPLKTASKGSNQGASESRQPERGFWNKSRAEISSLLWWAPNDVDWNSSSNVSPFKEGQLSSFSTGYIQSEERDDLKRQYPLSGYSLSGKPDIEDTRTPLDSDEKKRRSELKEEFKERANKALGQCIAAVVKDDVDDVDYVDYVAELKSQFEKAFRRYSKGLAQYMNDAWSKLDAGKPSVVRSKRIPIKPTEEQHRVFRMWLADSRTTYNIALEIILKRKLHLASEIVKMNYSKAFESLEIELVKLCVSKNGILASKKRYKLLRTPKVIRQEAVRSLIASLKQFKTNCQKRLELRKKYPANKKFEKDLTLHLRFKSKADVKQDSMSFNKKHFHFVDESRFSLFPRINPLTYLWRKGVLEEQQPKSWDGRTKHKWPTINAPSLMSSILVDSSELSAAMGHHGFKVHYKLGQWYLIVCERIQVDDEKFQAEVKQKDLEEECALDPGIRNFLTGFSPEGEAFILAGNVTKVLEKSCRRIDKRRKIWQRKVQKYKNMISAIGNSMGPATRAQQARLRARRRARRQMRRASRKYHAAETKAVNKIKDLHYKAAHALCSRYKTIFYPTFNAHEIAQLRYLNRGVKRRLNMLSFYMFSQRLIQVATKYGTTILRGDERYTSKQCGNCGSIHEKLGSAEVFNCPKCSKEGHRDVHAARNILLKHLQKDQQC